jgi:hypothetical protein
MIWLAVLGASFVAFALKFTGYVVPVRWLDHPRIIKVTALLPACLLAALVVVQTFTAGHHVVVDARAAGLGAAFVALLLRAPFLVVVIAAAVTAALVRAAGWG